VIDPNRIWTVDRNRLRSKGKNTPFHGHTMNGKAIITIMGGEIIYQDLP
jgi:dihydroorotase